MSCTQVSLEFFEQNSIGGWYNDCMSSIDASCIKMSYVVERNCGTRHDNATKERTIAMRREGKTYSEILAVIPVAKSTLSLWLREVGLSTPQQQAISEKRVEAQKKAARARHDMAVEKRQSIYHASREQIGNLTDREVWLLATMAYWAEGAKEKKHKTSSGVEFSNMDPRMIRVFVYWLIHIQQVPIKDITFEIYIHENNRHRVEIVQKYWSIELALSLEKLSVVRFKTHKINTNRKNIGNLYYGLIRVRVVASSTLVRQLEGWAQGVDFSIKNRTTINP